MTMPRPAPTTGTTAQFVDMVPVFLGVVTGIGVFVLAPSPLFRLAGLGIIGFAFLITDMLTVKRVLLAVIIFEIPIQVDIYLKHDQAVAARQALSGYNLSVTTVCLVALYAIWASERIGGSRHHDSGLFRAVLPAAVYGAVVLGSLAVATEGALVLYEFTIVIQAILLLIYIGHAVRTRGDALLVVGLLLFGILLQFGFSALAYATGSAVRIGVITSELIGGRLAGTVGHPNSLGGFLAMTLPLSAAMVIAPVGIWYRRMAGAAFVCGAVLLGLAQSRGGFFGFIAGLFVVFAVAYARRLVPRKTLARAVVIAAVPLSLMLVLVASRLAAYDNAAATGRLPLIGLALEVIASSPLTGVGANNFAAVLDQFLTIDYNVVWISTVHNKYLLVWAETGIIGFAAFMWFLVSTIKRGVALVRVPNLLYATIATGVLGGIVAALVHMIVELYHSRPLVQTLFVLAGLMIALHRMSQRDASDSPMLPMTVDA